MAVITDDKLKQLSDTYKSAGSKPADFDIKNIEGFLGESAPKSDIYYGFAKYLDSLNEGIQPYKSSTGVGRNAISSILSALPLFDTPYFDVVLKFYKRIPGAVKEKKADEQQKDQGGDLNPQSETDGAFYMYLGPRVQEFDIPFPQITKTVDFNVGGMTISRPASEVEFPTKASFDIMEDASFTFVSFFNNFRHIDYPLYGDNKEYGGKPIHDIVNYYTQNGYTIDIMVFINKDPKAALPRPAFAESTKVEPNPGKVKVEFFKEDETYAAQPRDPEYPNWGVKQVVEKDEEVKKDDKGTTSVTTKTTEDKPQTQLSYLDQMNAHRDAYLRGER